MAVWKIEPAASPEDTRWLDHPIWKQVIVRAPTAALARRAASRLEEVPDRPPAGNESASYSSAFEDELLYRVTRLGDEGESARGKAHKVLSPRRF